MNQKFSASVKFAIKLSVAVGAIAWLLHSRVLDLHVLAGLFRPEYLLVFVLLALANLLINHGRWVMLLQASAFRVRFIETLPLTFIGLFFNFALPGGVGGDVVKGYYLLREAPGRRMDAAMTILLDRIIGMFSMLILSGLCVAVNWRFVMTKPELVSLAAIIALFLIFFIFASFLIFTGHLDPFIHLAQKIPVSSVQKSIEKLHGGFKAFRSEPAVLFKCILVSWISHSAALAFIGFVAHLTAPGIISFWALFFVVPLGLIVMTLPISVAGIGVGQAAFYFLFKIYTGHDTQVGPNAITAFQLVQLGLGLIGAFIYLQKRRILTPAVVVRDV